MFRRILSHLTKNNQSSRRASYSLKSDTTGGHRNSLLLIDTSPSMNQTDWKPSRLGGALESASAYLAQLAQEDPNAYIAVVQYASTAKITVPLTQCRYAEAIQDQFWRIRTGFMTNITSGLKAAYNICSRCHGTNQVVLLSDGFHNLGSNPRRISDKLKEYATIECVGIGGSPTSVDEKLMMYIASSRADGTKRYRWIGKKEILVQHFRELAGGLARS